MRSSAKEIGAFNENGRNFVATKDTSRDFSNSQDNTDRGSMSDQAFACSASSVESLPSASGSSKYTNTNTDRDRDSNGVADTDTRVVDTQPGLPVYLCLSWQFRVFGL